MASEETSDSGQEGPVEVARGLARIMDEMHEEELDQQTPNPPTRAL